MDFFTWTGIGSLTAAVAAVVVVTNTARHLLKIDSPWVAFVVSMVVVYSLALVNGVLHGPADYVISFLNACLLFCTAVGANQSAVAGAGQRSGDPQAYGQRDIHWLQPWFRRP